MDTNDKNQLSAASSQTTPYAQKRQASQFVGFFIDGQQYAFRIEEIQEIVILDQVTPTPQVVDYVEGVSNLRGNIIPVINLRRLLGRAPKPADAETRTIVVNVSGRTMGCTVDMVSQIIRATDDCIRHAPETVTSGGAEYVSAFIQLENGLAIILDIEKLLNPREMENIALRDRNR